MFRDVSQTHILNQFDHYKAIQSNTIFPANNLNDGECNGFSICYAAMSAIGELDWWKAILLEASVWYGYGEKKSLDADIYLPGPDPERATPLGLVIEKAFQYISLTQLEKPVKEFANLNVEQNNLLLPGGSFEIADKNGFKKVQDRIVSISTPEKLLTLLSQHEDSLQTKMCVLKNIIHTCAIRYEKGEWFFYNPNNPLGEINLSNNDSIQRMKHSLPGDCLMLEIASLEGPLSEKLKNQAQELILPKCAQELTANRIIHIARYAAEFLPPLLALIEKNKALTPVFFHALQSQDLQNLPVLPTIVRYMPSSLPSIFNLVKEDEVLQKSLAHALQMKEKDDWTALHMIAHNAPQALSELLHLAKDNPELLRGLAHALPLQEKTKAWTVLHMIARNAPKTLLTLLDLANEVPELLSSLAHTLPLKNQGDWTVLHIIGCFSPECVPALLGLAKNNNELLKSLSYTLQSQDTDAWTGFNIIARHAPQAIPELFNLAKDHYVVLNSLMHALQIREEEKGWTPLQIIACDTPQYFPLLLNLVKDNTEFLNDFTQALQSQDKHGWTGLHLLIRYTPDCLPPLLDLLNPHHNETVNFTQALSTSSDGWTPLHVLIFYAADKLPMLFDFAKQKREVMISLLQALSVKITVSDEAVILNNSGFELIFARAPECKIALDNLFFEAYQSKLISIYELSHYLQLAPKNDSPDDYSKSIIEMLIHLPTWKKQGVAIFNTYLPGTIQQLRQGKNPALSDKQDKDDAVHELLELMAMADKKIIASDIIETSKAFCLKWKLCDEIYFNTHLPQKMSAIQKRYK